MCVSENVRRQWTGEARRACQIEEREGERGREREREKERKTNPINNHFRMSLCVCVCVGRSRGWGGGIDRCSNRPFPQILYGLEFCWCEPVCGRGSFNLEKYPN